VPFLHNRRSAWATAIRAQGLTRVGLNRQPSTPWRRTAIIKRAGFKERHGNRRDRSGWRRRRLRSTPRDLRRTHPRRDPRRQPRRVPSPSSRAWWTRAGTGHRARLHRDFPMLIGPAGRERFRSSTHHPRSTPLAANRPGAEIITLPPCGEGPKMQSIFGGGGRCWAPRTAPHPKKKNRCAIFRPPHKGEVIASSDTPAHCVRAQGPAGRTCRSRAATTRTPFHRQRIAFARLVQAQHAARAPAATTCALRRGTQRLVSAGGRSTIRCTAARPRIGKALLFKTSSHALDFLQQMKREVPNGRHAFPQETSHGCEIPG